MHPFLFDWAINGHHFRLPTYGVLLSLAFSLGYFLALRRALILKESPSHVENIFLLVILGSVIGGRAFHVIFEEFEYYSQHPNKILAVWEGGYTFYGSLIGAITTHYLYCRFRKLDRLQFLDLATPSVLLGLFIGRWGCFFAGCCWGKPTSLPWGIAFTSPDAFSGIRGVRLHPAQLYESGGALIILFYLEWLFKRRKYPGQIFFHGLIAYGILRFVVEYFRGDDYRGFVFGGVLSYSQLVSLAILLLAFAGMAVYSKQKPAAQ